MNHRELCEIGAKFLKRPESANGHGCHFAIIEPACYGENPDVFGVRHGTTGSYEYNGKFYERGHDVGTVLLEAKTSRADFFADRKKPHRLNPETGVGKWRYFICPKDLIKPDELPEKWGLIYVMPNGNCKIIAGAMAVPKQKHVSEWGGQVRYWRNGRDLEKSFKDYAFNDRNLQNEMNLLTMALARLKDPEQILYMQRNYSRLEQRCDELQRQLNKAQRDVNHREILKTLENLNEKTGTSNC